MSYVLVFFLGVVVCAVVQPLFRWLQDRIRKFRQTSSPQANQVTTVSQVLHLTVQGSPTGVTVLDRSGDVILSNASAHNMALVHERTVNPNIWSLAEQVYEDKETRILNLEIPKRRTGNRVTNVRAAAMPLTLNDDRFVVVYGTDETENARMESARRDFVANVSHELKTPVGGIALLAEALLDAPEDAEHVEYFGSRVLKEAQRMGDLVRELIALSKLQGAESLPDMKPVSVDVIVDEAISRNQLAADSADIEIIRGDSAGVQVLADRPLLVTAVSNLISNAIHYSPDALPVSISQKVVGGELVLIRVTDRGIGIDPENQKRVFERFFRVDKARSRSTGGTGLGLAIVKHVVANHGGNIKLWSRPGTGSTFTIELPIFESENTTEATGTRDNDDQVKSASARLAGRGKDDA